MTNASTAYGGLGEHDPFKKTCCAVSAAARSTTRSGLVWDTSQLVQQGIDVDSVAAGFDYDGDPREFDTDDKHYCIGLRLRKWWLFKDELKATNKGEQAQRNFFSDVRVALAEVVEHEFADALFSSDDPNMWIHEILDLSDDCFDPGDKDDREDIVVLSDLCREIYRIVSDTSYPVPISSDTAKRLSLYPVNTVVPS